MFIREIWGKFTWSSFGNFEMSHFTRNISKCLKSELGKFISNFPLKHVITATISTKLKLKKYSKIGQDFKCNI